MNPRVGILVLLALALVAGGAFLAFRGPARTDLEATRSAEEPSGSMPGGDSDDDPEAISPRAFSEAEHSLAPKEASEKTTAASPFHGLHVRVLDAQGKPRQGVPVALFSMDSFRPGSVKRSDGLGLARFPLSRSAKGPWRVGLTHLGAREPIPAVASDGADPVVLRLPPVGRVRIVLEDQEGRRLDQPEWLVLRIQGEKKGKEAACRGGSLLFANVPTHLDLEAFLSWGGERRQLLSRGDREEGQEERLVFRLERPPTLRIRVRAPNGWLGGTGIALHLKAPALRRAARHRAVADREAWIHVPLPSSLLDASQLEIEASAEVGDTELEGRISWSLNDAPLQELGVLQLAPLPIIASGRVVNRQGEGQSGLDLELTTRDPGVSYETISGPDGSFVIRGRPEPGTLARLSVVSLRVCAKTMQLKIPTSRIRIEVVEPAELLLKLEAHHRDHSSQLHAVLRDAAGERFGPFVPTNGVLRFTDLVPGSYRFGLELPWGEALLPLRALELRSGKQAPAELQELFFPELRWVTLRLESAGGSPRSGVRVRIHGPRRLTRLTDSEGRVRLLVKERSPALSITPKKGGPIEIPGIAEDTRIVIPDER